MKYRPASKFCLIVFLSITLSLWYDTITLAESEPKDLEQVKLDEAQFNSQFPKFLILDKQNGRKSLIKIEKQLGGKEMVQKETADDCKDLEWWCDQISPQCDCKINPNCEEVKKSCPKHCKMCFTKKQNGPSTVEHETAKTTTEETMVTPPHEMKNEGEGCGYPPHGVICFGKSFGLCKEGLYCQKFTNDCSPGTCRKGKLPPAKKG